MPPTIYINSILSKQFQHWYQQDDWYLQDNLLSLDNPGANMEYGREVSKLIGRKLNETMLHSLTILTVLRLLSDGKCYLLVMDLPFPSCWRKNSISKILLIRIYYAQCNVIFFSFILIQPNSIAIEVTYHTNEFPTTN